MLENRKRINRAVRIIPNHAVWMKATFAFVARKDKIL